MLVFGIFVAMFTAVGGQFWEEVKRAFVSHSDVQSNVKGNRVDWAAKAAMVAPTVQARLASKGLRSNEHTAPL